MAHAVGRAALWSVTRRGRLVLRARGRRLWGLWERYRWIWISAGWTWPFVVDDMSMPHVHTIVRGALQAADPASAPS